MESVQKEGAALRATQDAEIQKQVGLAREAFASDNEQVVKEIQAEHFRSQQRLQGKVNDLQRQLQRKSSDDLGEGAEVNLLEALKAEFPSDKIRRVPRGEPGADIVHVIMNGETECGKIMYNSKNRNQWRNDWVEKLRRDQLAEGADHGVLTAHKFPHGEAHLCIRDEIIVVNPARAVEVVRILREALIQLTSLRLSSHEREQKIGLVYNYITSDRFRQRMGRVAKLADDLEQIDVDERNAHEKTWDKRGSKIKQLEKANAEVTLELNRILMTEMDDTDLDMA